MASVGELVALKVVQMVDGVVFEMPAVLLDVETVDDDTLVAVAMVLVAVEAAEEVIDVVIIEEEGLEGELVMLVAVIVAVIEEGEE